MIAATGSMLSHGMVGENIQGSPLHQFYEWEERQVALRRIEFVIKGKNKTTNP